MSKQWVFIIIATILSVIILLLITELIFVKLSGSGVPTPTISRLPQILGIGPKLTYVVMGDSTSISQGSKYEKGFAAASAQYLAKNYNVTFVNTGISGATAKDVLDKQLDMAITHKPDLVLLSVGANDATSFTSGQSIQDSMQNIIESLRRSNSKVHIIVTGSPAMDSVSRFPFVSKAIMRLRTYQVNKAFEKVIAKYNLTLAPIAQKTRAAFLADPTLTAADNFHPNASGYALWIPVINEALDKAIAAR